MTICFASLSKHLKSVAVLVGLFACSTAVHAQSGTTITTSGTQKVTTIGATNQLVDSNVTLSGSATISKVSVTVSSGYTSGDVLAYNSAALPGTVTGSFSSATGILTFTGSASTAQYQALLRTVTISLASSSAATRSVTFSVGNLGSYTNGHYYEFVTTAATWTNAKTAAAARTYNGLTGYLATVTSAGENTYIKQTLSADGWIGASDDYLQINAATGSTYTAQTSTEGKWYWVTGPEKGTNFSNGNSPSVVTVSGQYSNWNSGEPNNSSSNENFCEIYASGTNVGAWNDLGPSQSLGYVVEYGGMAGDPVVQLSATRNILVQATSVTGTYNTGDYKVNTIRKVDSLVEVKSVSSITNAKVTVSSGFRSGDVLDFSTAALPTNVTGAYNSTTGVLSFTGTATAAQFQTLFRTVTFKATSGTYSNREVTFSIGNLVAYTNGHFYEYVTSSAITWANAKTGAAAKTYLGKTGYLATITSAGENAFIKQTLSSDGWIGGSDDYNEINASTGATTFASQAASEGRWYWVTGPEKGTNISNGNSPSVVPVSGQYTNWASGEPNNSGSNENFMQMYASGTAPGQWNDLNGTSQNGYVVEYGGLASDPVVTLSSTSLMTVRGDALPVRELKLAASGQRQLTWNTVNEQYVDHFDLERSADGQAFVAIAAVPSKGAGNFSYSETDKTIPEGRNFYRVAAVDLSGARQYSNIVTLERAASGYELTLAPNPVRNQLNLTRTTDGSAVVSILDLSGRTIMTRAISGYNNILDLSQLPAGGYLLTIRDAGGQSSRTLFKQ